MSFPRVRSAAAGKGTGSMEAGEEVAAERAVDNKKAAEVRNSLMEKLSWLRGTDTGAENVEAAKQASEKAVAAAAAGAEGDRGSAVNAPTWRAGAQ